MGALPRSKVVREGKRSAKGEAGSGGQALPATRSVVAAVS